MAATRLIALHQNKGRTLNKCIGERTDYAMNPDKTENGTYVTSYACDPKTVDEEFAVSKRDYEQMTGRKRTDNVIAYQIRQSFKPGEITPKEANRIGYETAMRFTKGNHAFIVATHTDRAHIHNHVVFCASNIKHTKKFRDFHKSGLALQKVSDLICLEHGLSVISPRPYNEREKRTVFPQREAFRDVIRESIDMALSKRPKNFDDFLLELRAAGYEIKRGKHTAIRGRGQKRFIRFRSLGDGYTEAEIKNKIGCISSDKKLNKNAKAKSDEKFDLLLSLQDIIAKGKGPGYELWAKKYNVKNVMKAILFFQEQGLRNYEELAEKAESSASRFNEVSSEIKTIEKRMNEISELRGHIINYSKTREIYVKYRESGYSKKYFAEHKEDIMIHKAAKDAFQKLGAKKIPKVSELNIEFQELLSRKRKLYSEYRDVKEKMTKYQIAKYDIDRLLDIGESKEPDQDKKKERDKSR